MPLNTIINIIEILETTLVQMFYNLVMVYTNFVTLEIIIKVNLIGLKIFSHLEYMTCLNMQCVHQMY